MGTRGNASFVRKTYRKYGNNNGNTYGNTSFIFVHVSWRCFMFKQIKYEGHLYEGHIYIYIQCSVPDTLSFTFDNSTYSVIHRCYGFVDDVDWKVLQCSFHSF